MLKTKTILLIIFLVCLAQLGDSQSSTLPFNPRAYDILDRLEILHGSGNIYHSPIKYFSRKDATQFAFEVGTNNNLTTLDKEDLKFIFTDNDEWYNYLRSEYELGSAKAEEIFEKSYIDSTNTFFTIRRNSNTEAEDSGYNEEQNRGWFGIFYKSPANMFEFKSDDFFFKLNPIINFSFGNDSAQSDPVFQNTKGLQARGAVDGKVYFYTSIFENQRNFLAHINQRIDQYKAIPGNGFYKEYNSSVLGSFNGWDYLNAQAFVGLNVSKSIGLEFGHGKHFIGNGYHSLLLNDYGHNYFYLKFNSKFWKLHYQNIFAELSVLSSSDNKGNFLLPKKYLAAHYLDFEITEDLSVGLYEAVVFNRANHFEFQYLNPIIIYRTVEQFLDSPDNVLIGLNAKWNIKNRFQVYGQFILDEFDLDELKSGDGYWGNKYGFQLGAKYINVANIDHLDARIEYNLVKPYTFQHRDTLTTTNNITSANISTASYSHYSQPLSHPLGANFKEFLVTLNYRPLSKLFLSSRLMIANYGQDTNNENWGSNVTLSYYTRQQDFGNTIGQGIETKVVLFGFDASYELYHNIFADLHFLIRNQDAQEDVYDINTTYLGAGIRMNIANQKLDY